MHRHNIGKSLELMGIKDELSEYITEADYKIISQLGYNLLEKEWNPEELKENLGTDAIEALLDEVENADYDRLVQIHTALKKQGFIK